LEPHGASGGRILSLDGYVDIHSHILPGIDDGPADMDGSIAMARAAADAGISTVAATPHLRSDFPDVHVEELAKRVEEVRAALEREEIPLTVVSGAEVALMWAVDASDDHLRLATYGQRGTDLLIETPSAGIFGLDRFLYELRTRGLRVTLAHPERCADFHRNPEALRALVTQGVLLQVNADALVDAGRRSAIRRLAEQLCTEGLAHVLASDGHRASSWRPVTKLAEGLEALTELVGSERARWMASDVPSAIVEGAQLPPEPPVATGVRRRWPFSLG
jgi:protein-tyrosine phosphatase